jgi:hypothetical protein
MIRRRHRHFRRGSITFNFDDASGVTAQRFKFEAQSHLKT